MNYKQLFLISCLMIAGCGTSKPGPEAEPSAPACTIEQYSNGGLERCSQVATLQFHSEAPMQADVVDVCQARGRGTGGELVYAAADSSVVRVRAGALERLPVGTYYTQDVKACQYTVFANGSIN